MERQEALDKFVDVIAGYCSKKEALEQKDQLESLKFVDDLGINSARLVDIVIDMEDKFDIEIADDEADKIMTVGDAVDVVINKVS